MDYLTAAPKTDMFRMRINPELHRQLEEVYAKNGLTLTEAVNVFFQQSLNAGGFPFAVSAENEELCRARALSRLTKELEKGENDPVSFTETEVYGMFGAEK